MAKPYSIPVLDTILTLVGWVVGNSLRGRLATCPRETWIGLPYPASGSTMLCVCLTQGAEQRRARPCEQGGVDVEQLLALST